MGKSSSEGGGESRTVGCGRIFVYYLNSEGSLQSEKRVPEGAVLHNLGI